MTTPFVAAAATFVATSNISGSVRKKDDQYNWFIGGVSTGSILGAYYKSYRIGFICSTILGLGLLGVKLAHLNKYELYSLPDKMIGEAATSHKYDFTLTKERPRNWTTGN